PVDAVARVEATRHGPSGYEVRGRPDRRLVLHQDTRRPTGFQCREVLTHDVIFQLDQVGGPACRESTHPVGVGPARVISDPHRLAADGSRYQPSPPYPPVLQRRTDPRAADFLYYLA